MRVLLVNDAFNLGSFLSHLLAQREETLSLQVVSMAELRASLTPIQQCDVDVIVIGLFVMPWHQAEELALFTSVFSACQASAKAQGSVLISFSSSAVFDGSRIAYHEADKPCPANDYGHWLTRQEQLLCTYDKSIIIRTAWLYSATGGNFLTACIEHASQQRLIQLDSAAKACPTAVADLARVVLAVLLQLELGADNWGIFHYVASDTALGFQFMEAILNQAAKYDETINPKQVLFEHHEKSTNQQFYFSAVVLKCSRLLDNFGIHQRPWRAVMPSVVAEYYKQQEK